MGTDVTMHPVLHYRDPEAALRFLADAFGVEEGAVHRGPDGQVAYVEARLGDCWFGFGRTTEGGPFDLGPTVVYVAVDEVDSRFERAAATGTEVVMPPTDQDYGSRDFAVRDPEGNVWSFGTYRPGPPA
ncbi:MAG: VOC family protein [Thermoanaerobacterales bacterium]|jgi:uncharacterized glyoxalase superfamily protein PhnB|nr:hypothetical protein [Thermoanaerobacterales bacterium]